MKKHMPVIIACILVAVSIVMLINHFNNDILEPFNTQVRYILNLIEVHRTNFIQEDEILTK